MCVGVSFKRSQANCKYEQTASGSAGGAAGCNYYIVKVASYTMASVPSSLKYL